MKSALSAPHFHNEEAAFAYVEAKLWPNGPVCPKCGTVGRAGKLKGKTTRPGLYKCYACRKPFTVRMGTIFESSHVPLRYWLQAIYLMCSSKKGISTRQLQRTFGGSMKTAWFLSHRIREAMKEVRDLFTPPLGGAGKTVEVDETYVGRKHQEKVKGGAAHKNPVVALVERGGTVRSWHVPDVTIHNLTPILQGYADKRSRLITDESALYPSLGRAFASHMTVNHGEKEWVRDDVYTNTAEGYFSVLKRGIYGIYQHVSEAHLKRYLAEFDFRYSNRAKLGVNDAMRADRALAGAKGKRLTYRTVGGKRAASLTEARSARA
jgi:transposase-like protein